ncbi:MAG: VWA domain-containing protein [Acidobacteriota bacterium]|nr:VWA domain-containing protein [Acidobacteriota bacterium]
MRIAILYFLASGFSFAWQIDEKISVVVRNVRVHVVDKNGEPVTGLTRDDFQVWEDGKPRKLTFFDAVDLPAQAEIDETEADRTSLSAGDPSAAQGSSLPVRAFVIYIDTGTMRKKTFTQVRRAAAHFIKNQMLSTDRVKLVHFDGVLTQITPFTNNKRKLLAGLKRIKPEGTYRKILANLNFRIIGSTYEEDRSLPIKPWEKHLRKKGEAAATFYRQNLLGLLGAGYMLQAQTGERSIILFHGYGYRFNNITLGSEEVEKLEEEWTRFCNTGNITVYSNLMWDEMPVFQNKEVQSAMPSSTYADDLLTRRATRVTNLRGGHRNGFEGKLVDLQLDENKSNKDVDQSSLAEAAAGKTGGIFHRPNTPRALTGAMVELDRHSRHFYKLAYVREEGAGGGKLRIRLKNGRGLKLFYGRQFEARPPYIELTGEARVNARETLVMYAPPTRDDFGAAWSHAIFPNDGGGLAVHMSGLLPDFRPGGEVEFAFAALDGSDQPMAMQSMVLSADSFNGKTGMAQMLYTDHPPARLRFYARDMTTGDYSLAEFAPADLGRMSDPVLSQSGRFDLMEVSDKQAGFDPLLFDGQRIIPLPANHLDTGAPVGLYFHYTHGRPLTGNFGLRVYLRTKGKAYGVATKVTKVARVTKTTYGFQAELNLPEITAEDAELEIVLTKPDGSTESKKLLVTLTGQQRG